MFEKTIASIRQLSTISIPVTGAIPQDSDGYIDRECPSPDCLFTFKVLAEDWWSDKVRDDEAFCPFCGHAAPARSWFTTEQADYLQEHAASHLQQAIGGALAADASAFNRKQPRNGFLKITMNVSRAPLATVMPVEATDPMRLRIDCEKCHCRYAVVGSAFFCPGCGDNAAEHVFGQALGAIRNSIASLPAVKAVLNDADTAHNMSRLLIEGGIQNAVTAFQRFAEALFHRRAEAPKYRRNAFQNLAEGSELWRSLFGKTYAEHLTASELSSLGTLFQQRHLLAHKEGTVDEDYIAKSNDHRYKAGQRIVIREDAVLRCVELIEKLAAGMKADADAT